MSRERQIKALDALPTMSALSHLKEAARLIKDADSLLAKEPQVFRTLEVSSRLKKAGLHIDKAIEIETR